MNKKDKYFERRKFIYLIIESINNEIRRSQMGKTTQPS